MTDDMTGGINLSKLWVLCSVFSGVSKEAGGGSLINRAFPFVFGTGFHPFITFSPLIVKPVVKDATPVLFRCMHSDILTLGLVEREALIKICSTRFLFTLLYLRKGGLFPVTSPRY